MRRSHTLIGLFVTALAGLLLASAAPVSADTHVTARYRIGDADSRTFATAHTTTRYVTMQPPSADTLSQYWAFSDTTVGTRIASLLTSGCLAAEQSTTTRPVIVQAPCATSANQHWRIVSSSSTNTVIFRNLGINGCMVVDPTGTVPARLFLAPCNAADRNQHFRLVA